MSRLSRVRRATFGALWLAACAATVGFAASACHGWDPLDPFQHDAPEVDEAIGAMDGGRYKSAEQILAEYLHTGVCGDGGIGLPDEVRLKPNGSFDLGLTLFHLAEKFGKRFGDEEADAGAKEQPEARAAEVGCALVIVKAIAQDAKVPPELRARAFYLAGNLAFLNRDYKDAIKLYDAALGIVPGLPADAAVDGIGRDAAHNRAIALRRLDDQQDGGEDDAGDGGDAGSGDGGDAGDGSGDQDASDGGGKGDGGDDGGDDGDDEQQKPGRDAGKDASADPKKDQQGSPQPSSPEPAKPEGAQEDERMLDRLEEAPSYQQQEGRVRARRRRSMEDK